MTVSYFPGCTLRNTARALDTCARECAEALGVTLEELPDWQCCGGVYTTARDEIATKLAAVRALREAERRNQPLVSVCAACHNVLKQTNEAFLREPDFAAAVNAYLPPEERYSGGAIVLHYLELLRDVVGFERVREVAERAGFPLAGQRVGAYYGCLLLRPSSVLHTDDPENPRLLENLLTALGAEPMRYASRNECCGGYTLLEDGGVAASAHAGAILHDARAAGAKMLVTACPLCRYNLERAKGDLPVLYFTELLARGMGLPTPNEEPAPGRCSGTSARSSSPERKTAV